MMDHLYHLSQFRQRHYPRKHTGFSIYHSRFHDNKSSGGPFLISGKTNQIQIILGYQRHIKILGPLPTVLVLNSFYTAASFYSGGAQCDIISHRLGLL